MCMRARALAAPLLISQQRSRRTLKMIRLSQEPVGTSAAAVAAVLVLCCLCTVPVSGIHQYGHQPSTNINNLVGTVCQVPFGFLPLTCGDYEVISNSSEPVPIFKYGPNVCRNTRTVRRNEREYRYQRYCDWVFDRYYYNWVQRCSLICQPTNNCTNRNQTSNFSRIECCAGYQTRPASKNEHYTYYYQIYYQRVQSLPVGCPRAVGESLLQCLLQQNLTEFIKLVNRSSFMDLISANNPNMSITVFAPTNAAFDAVRNQLTDLDPDMVVGNHIINGTVKESDLVNNRRFMNILGLMLHSTVASFPDTSSISYYNTPFTNVHFINGARIVNRDACVTTNGTLHIIDRVLMPGNMTIAEVLLTTDRYSRFRDALEAAGTLGFLMMMDISRTVFVPPNDTFEAAIPDDLFNCLTAYMRLPLQDLVLHHISGKTDYSTTLALQGYIYTLQLSPIIISTDSAGVISLGRDMAIQISMPNIPASNGVIHEINGVLMPSGFNFGKCQVFAPTTPPPTTPPPTTAPPTTPPPTTPPPTTPPPTTAPPTTLPPDTLPPTTAPVTFARTTEDPMATDRPAPGEGSAAEGIGDIVPAKTEAETDFIDYEANP